MSRRLTTSLLTVLAIALLAGCDTAALHHLRGRAHIVNTLAAIMDRYQLYMYRADYRLADGSAATVAHGSQPQRSEYWFTSGRYVVTPTVLATCTGTTTCTLVTPYAYGRNNLDTAAVRRVSDQRFVPVEEVMSIITDAAQADGTTFTPTGATIAGQYSHCVSVTGSTTFDACITSRGVLSRFTGTVHGHKLDIEMTRFQRVPSGVSFGTPPGATIIDHRTTS